ncbi:MAG: TPM domain-containing protein [Porphyrobacter sp.]|nr:TPM domain-containing protein [Porphyrobacter sp.]
MGRRLAPIAALLTLGCAAEATPEPPAPVLALTGRVVDAAGVLSPDTETRLTGRLAALEKETGLQLVVATTPDLGGQTIEAYALALANGWGLGDAQRNDGLLLLVALNQRKVRIEVGYGLEASVRDEDAAVIIQDIILPQFRQQAFDAGVEAGVAELVREVTPVRLKEAA